MDGKRLDRPDGTTLIPYQVGKMLVWDITVVSSLRPTPVSQQQQQQRGEPAMSLSRLRLGSVIVLPDFHLYLCPSMAPAVETLVPMNAEALESCLSSWVTELMPEQVTTDGRRFSFNVFQSAGDV
jgi:hypothetical protein